MVTSTRRQKILEYLQQRGAASATQIGIGLGMSAATVRHHLAILAADARLVPSASEPRRRRGRPEKKYKLSDRVLGDNLDRLSDALLSRWLDVIPKSKREAAIRGLGRSLSVESGSIAQQGALPRRMVELVDKLNRLHYMARWEAGRRGPHVLLGHCPYAAIIEEHPELCVMDAAFLEADLGAQVEQLAKLSAKPGGATHCLFAVGPSSQR